jgi:hypothetical protein
MLKALQVIMKSLNPKNQDPTCTLRSTKENNSYTSRSPHIILALHYVQQEEQEKE